MAVAIASHPASKGEPRQIGRRRAEFGGPGVLEALVQQLDYVGKNPAQIIKDALHFTLDLRPLRADFAGAPQAFESGFQTAAKDGGFDFREPAVVAFD